MNNELEDIIKSILLQCWLDLKDKTIWARVTEELNKICLVLCDASNNSDLTINADKLIVDICEFNTKQWIRVTLYPSYSFDFLPELKWIPLE